MPSHEGLVARTDFKSGPAIAAVSKGTGQDQYALFLTSPTHSLETKVRDRALALPCASQGNGTKERPLMRLDGSNNVLP